MLLPIRTDSPLRTRPWVNWSLIAACVIVFLIDRSLPKLGHPYLAERFALSARDPYLLRFFTYAFLHDGWLHLAGNMLALYIFGGNVNSRLGHLGYLAFYLSGAVFAGIGVVLTDTSPLPMVGCSGAAMAVMGAYLALYPRSNVTVLSIIGAFEIPSMYLIILFFLFELMMNFAAQPGVAHMAHVSGMLFGFALSMALLHLKLLPRDQWDFLALLQRWNRRRQYQMLVRQGYNPFGYAPPAGAAPRQESAEAAIAARIEDLRAEISEALAHHNLPHAAMLFLELLAIDPRQVLSRQAQLDVANQLTSQQFYPQAADAYEQFIRHYGNYPQIEHVELMLGIIYARHLQQSDRAKILLSRALQRLTGEREIAMARTELARLDSAPCTPEAS